MNRLGMEASRVSHRTRYSWLSLENLESRVVMSHGGLSSFLSSYTNPFHHSSSSSHPAPAITMGAVGDSLTDPYQGYQPDRSLARNWVEQLASSRHVSFGSFSKNVHGQSGHPGYANDWAVSGATSSDLVSNQLPALAGQVAKGQVKYAAVLIGDNDFGQFLAQAPGLASDQAALLSKLVQVEQTAQTNFDTTVQTLLQASPSAKLVVATIADIASTSAVQAQLAPLGTQGQDLAQMVSQAIGAYNQHIRSVAASSNRIALADLAAVDSSLAQSTSPLQVGGVTVKMTQTGDDYHNFLLADGVHPGTLAQGLIANTIVGALNSTFQAGIHPLTSAQLVRVAQRADGAGVTPSHVKK
jgi:phospholipase/lecithinase/hemolysin